MAKRIWDNYIIIGEVQKTERIKFVVAAATRDGFRFINIREFYQRRTDNVWRPGRDGITIPLVTPTQTQGVCTPLHDILEVLREHIDLLNSMELFDEDNAVYAEEK